MKNWIWWQKIAANDAVQVSGYYNISHEPEQNTCIFISSFDGKGPFERAKEKKKAIIGFKIK